nr:hypothetical protein [Tanacetum cinerariifolium]
RAAPVESFSLGGDVVVPEDQQRAAPVIETAVGEPIGLGYGGVETPRDSIGRESDA